MRVTDEGGTADPDQGGRATGPPWLLGAWWSRFAAAVLPLPATLEPPKRDLARVLRSLVLFHLIFSVSGLLLAFRLAPSTLEWGMAWAGLVAVLISVGLLRAGRVHGGIAFEIGTLSVLTTILVIGEGYNAATASGMLVMAVLGTGLLLGRRHVRVAAGLAVAAVVVVYLAGLRSPSEGMASLSHGFGELVLALLAILLSGTLIDHGLRVVEQSLARSRRHAEALRASEERWRGYIERANDLIFTLDLEGRMTTANRAVRETLGYTSDELLGRNALELVAPWDRERAAEALATVLRGGTSEEWEYEVMDAGGRPILLEIRSRTLYDEAHAPSGSLHIGRDLTDRRRAEAALRQAQKQESLALLSGGVAHDFNNLLTVIMGGAAISESMLPDESPVRAQLQRVAGAAERAASLVRQLLAFAGQASLRIIPVDLSALVADDRDLLAAGLPGSVRLELDLADDLPYIHGDSSGLQQLVMNLVLNGAQAYAEQHGAVRVSTDVVELREPLPASESRAGQALPPGRYVRLRVADDGRGMGPDTLERIFDPFFTTKATGHGLGLAVTLGIVRSHHGALLVDSSPLEGTSFTLLFPVAPTARPPRSTTMVLGDGASAVSGDADAGAEGEADTEMVGDVDVARAGGGARAGAEATTTAATVSAGETGPATGDAPASASGSRNTVLVIDDEPAVREAITDVLGVHGLEVVAAADGHAGVAAARAHRSAIRVVLLDLTMPGLSGEQTCRLLHEAVPELPIVLISGYAPSQLDGRFEALGVAEFLAKPFSFSTLTELVDRYLG